MNINISIITRLITRLKYKLVGSGSPKIDMHTCFKGKFEICLDFGDDYI